MTARSESGSSPTISAANARPPGWTTRISRAPCTTWLLVSSSPSGVKKKPEPLPRRSRAGLRRVDVDVHDRGRHGLGRGGYGARVRVEQLAVIGGRRGEEVGLESPRPSHCLGARAGFKRAVNPSATDILPPSESADRWRKPTQLSQTPAACAPAPPANAPCPIPRPRAGPRSIQTVEESRRPPDRP